MAVIKCKERLGGRTARIDEAGNVTLTRVLSVETSDRADSQVVVVAGLRYPPADPAAPLGPVPVRLFDRHPEYKGALLRGVDANPTDSPTAWAVTLTYASGPFPARQGGAGAAPIDPAAPAQSPNNSSASAGNTNSKPAPLRLPSYSVSTREAMGPARTYVDNADLQTKPYVNPNGDKFDGLQVPFTSLVVSIHYWSVGMTLNAIRGRFGRVNAYPWNGFPSRSCIVRGITRKDVYDLLGYDGAGDEVYGLCWEVDVEVECVDQASAWNTKVLNTGRRGRLVAGGPVVQFFDRTGAYLPDPVPLNDLGVALRDPMLPNPTPIDPSEFTYTTFLDKRDLDFGSLLV